jgi:glycosyltransferase involved in cell wall biosynthesis
LKIAFITNFCSHYRIKTFERIGRLFDTDFYFFSAGDEWYWQQNHGINRGDFKYQYLKGFRLGLTRITPLLPVQLSRGNYDIYIKCINGKFTLPVTYFLARLKRKPLILWTGIWMRLQSKFHKLLLPITRYFYLHADAIVVYGDHVKKYLVSEGVPAERIFIAYHAVDNEAYNQIIGEDEKKELREQLNIPDDKKVILYLGRLEASKGVSYLVDAFESLADHEDAVLLLAGTGSEKEVLEEKVREKGIQDKVRFTGYIPTDQAVRYYSIAWVYVLPSITTTMGKEPWGLVVNEAFNQGIPVIATDAVGAAAGGLVQHDCNGKIVPEGNVQALSQALCEILDDPILRHQLSKNALSEIALWTNERMVDGFSQAIHYVIEGSKN